MNAGKGKVETNVFVFIDVFGLRERAAFSLNWRAEAADVERFLVFRLVGEFLHPGVLL